MEYVPSPVLDLDLDLDLALVLIILSSYSCYLLSKET